MNRSSSSIGAPSPAKKKKKKSKKKRKSSLIGRPTNGSMLVKDDGTTSSITTNLENGTELSGAESQSESQSENNDDAEDLHSGGEEEHGMKMSSGDEEQDNCTPDDAAGECVDIKNDEEKRLGVGSTSGPPGGAASARTVQPVVFQQLQKHEQKMRNLYKNSRLMSDSLPEVADVREQVKARVRAVVGGGAAPGATSSGLTDSSAAGTSIGTTGGDKARKAEELLEREQSPTPSTRNSSNRARMVDLHCIEVPTTTTASRAAHAARTGIDVDHQDQEDETEAIIKQVEQVMAEGEEEEVDAVTDDDEDENQQDEEINEYEDFVIPRSPSPDRGSRNEKIDLIVGNLQKKDKKNTTSCSKKATGGAAAGTTNDASDSGGLSSTDTGASDTDELTESSEEMDEKARQYRFIEHIKEIFRQNWSQMGTSSGGRGSSCITKNNSTSGLSLTTSTETDSSSRINPPGVPDSVESIIDRLYDVYADSETRGTTKKYCRAMEKQSNGRDDFSFFYSQDAKLAKTPEERRRAEIEIQKNRALYSERSDKITAEYTEEDAFLDALLKAMPRSFHTFYGDAAAYIFKSPHLSRGRGLKVMTCRGKLRPMLEEAYSRSALNQRWFCIVQKYLEKPFLVDYRGECVKCDLRLWVSALNWNPVVALVHHQPYFRFATKPFGFSRVKQDQRAHLTNRTIQETNDGVAKGAEDDDPDYQLVFEEFLNYLRKNYGEPWVERWHSFTWPLMLDAARCALLASQDAVTHAHFTYTKKAASKLERVGRQVQDGPKAFELYGVDFSLDYELRPWLLEANVSPDLLGHSGKTLKQQSRDALDELLTIVLKEPKSVPIGMQNVVQNPKIAGQNFTPNIPHSCLPPNIARQKVCCNDSTCFTRHGVNLVPPALVCGYQIGEKKWSLFLKGPRYEPVELADQFSRRKAIEWSKRAPYAQSCSNNKESAQPGHEAVIRRLLLNTPYSRVSKEQAEQLLKKNGGQLSSSPKSPKRPWNAVKSHFERDREKMEYYKKFQSGNMSNAASSPKIGASAASEMMQEQGAKDSPRTKMLNQISDAAEFVSNVLKGSKERMGQLGSGASSSSPGIPGCEFGLTKSGRPRTSGNSIVHNLSCEILPTIPSNTNDSENADVEINGAVNDVSLTTPNDDVLAGNPQSGTSPSSNNKSPQLLFLNKQQDQSLSPVLVRNSQEELDSVAAYYAQSPTTPMQQHSPGLLAEQHQAGGTSGSQAGMMNWQPNNKAVSPTLFSAAALGKNKQYEGSPSEQWVVESFSPNHLMTANVLAVQGAVANRSNTASKSSATGSTVSGASATTSSSNLQNNSQAATGSPAAKQFLYPGVVQQSNSNSGAAGVAATTNFTAFTTKEQRRGFQEGPVLGSNFSLSPYHNKNKKSSRIRGNKYELRARVSSGGGYNSANMLNAGSGLAQKSPSGSQISKQSLLAEMMEKSETNPRSATRVMELNTALGEQLHQVAMRLENSASGLLVPENCNSGYLDMNSRELNNTSSHQHGEDQLQLPRVDSPKIHHIKPSTSNTSPRAADHKPHYGSGGVTSTRAYTASSLHGNSPKHPTNSSSNRLPPKPTPNQGVIPTWKILKKSSKSPTDVDAVNGSPTTNHPYHGEMKYKSQYVGAGAATGSTSHLPLQGRSPQALLTLLQQAGGKGGDAEEEEQLYSLDDVADGAAEKNKSWTPIVDYGGGSKNMEPGAASAIAGNINSRSSPDHGANKGSPSTSPYMSPQHSTSSKHQLHKQRPRERLGYKELQEQVENSTSGSPKNLSSGKKKKLQLDSLDRDILNLAADSTPRTFRDKILRRTAAHRVERGAGNRYLATSPGGGVEHTGSHSHGVNAVEQQVHYLPLREEINYGQPTTHLGQDDPVQEQLYARIKSSNNLTTGGGGTSSMTNSKPRSYGGKPNLSELIQEPLSRKF
ncbi:unnamed protein product [Amoebophrya sp. A120]|nr:unnamed protein product [Amoebophrya sp. A120]|eukprot:GSA120T00020506001.1